MEQLLGKDEEEMKSPEVWECQSTDADLNVYRFPLPSPCTCDDAGGSYF